jgi:hypothetical protein
MNLSHDVPTTESSRAPSLESTVPLSQAVTKSAGNRDVPLLGLPRPMVDELLAAYFTHVHVSSASATGSIDQS